MPNERKPKRQRQKEARRAKREAMWEEYRRRQRIRRIALVVISLLVAGGAGGIVLALTGGDDVEDVLASPSPGTTPAPTGCQPNEEDDGAFERPTDQGLDPDKTQIWRLETTKGRIDIELDVERAPTTANSIAFLTREGFYDGLTFHRVVPGFVIQGGDPTGDGAGGPGYTCVEAPPSDLVYHEGIVAMAKTQAEPSGASGSQFFIVSGPEAEQLGVDFALVGRVIAGMDTVEAIAATVPTDEENPNPTPSEVVEITKATIV